MMKRKMIFGGFIIVLAFVLVSGLYAGGGKDNAPQPAGGGAAGFTGDKKSYSGYPLPIVPKPTTMTAIVGYSALRPNMDTTKVWDWFEEQTNLRIKPEIVRDMDRLSVLFASRDFPHIYMVSSTPATAALPLLTRAANDGDLLPLDDLVRQYAPTWDKFLRENPMVKNSCTINGKLYFLPNISFAPMDRDLRDQWIINEAWLKELGLKIPTTTGEFKTAMLAIKNNAGKGSIPKNVLPFYYFFDNYIGGQFDVYSSFGVTVTNVDYLAVENGKVVYQAINPAIKEPLKWLQELYREGLTPPECFTDDWNTYLTKNAANPPIIGSYGSYNNRNYAYQTAMPPLQSPNGKKPTMRRQAYVPNIAPSFAIFATNPDPVAAIKYAEFVAFDLEAKMNQARGMKDVFWKFESDGRVSQIFWEESPDKMTANAMQMGLHNSSLGLWDHDFYKNNFRDLDVNIPKSRSWAFENVYKNYLGPEGSVYVFASLSSDEENTMKLYNTDLTNLRKQTFARWITTNANIDAEWDAYVSQMMKLHVTEYTALKQKAYDQIMKK